jgi:hypothetical protein
MPIRIVLWTTARVRHGFRRILEDDPELQVAGEPQERGVTRSARQWSILWFPALLAYLKKI